MSGYRNARRTAWIWLFCSLAATSLLAQQAPAQKQSVQMLRAVASLAGALEVECPADLAVPVDVVDLDWCVQQQVTTLNACRRVLEGQIQIPLGWRYDKSWSAYPMTLRRHSHLVAEGELACFYTFRGAGPIDERFDLWFHKIVRPVPAKHDCSKIDGFKFRCQPKPSGSD